MSIFKSSSYVEEKYEISNNSIFCNNCNNLLILKVINNNIYYICLGCSTKYHIRPEDTLIYEETTEENLAKYEIIIKNIKNDYLNEKIPIKCNKCNHNIGIKIRIKNEQRILIICEKCDNIIINNQ